MVDLQEQQSNMVQTGLLFLEDYTQQTSINAKRSSCAFMTPITLETLMTNAKTATSSSHFLSKWVCNGRQRPLTLVRVWLSTASVSFYNLYELELCEQMSVTRRSQWFWCYFIWFWLIRTLFDIKVLCHLLNLDRSITRTSRNLCWGHQISVASLELCVTLTVW